MMTEKRKPTLWDGEGREIIRFADRDEAIEAILDEMHDPLPEKITIYGFAPREIDPNILSVLDNLLENLDEEYSNPEGDATEATDKMKEAEKAFLAAILEEYQVWSCEEVCREEIIVDQWLKETEGRNNP